MYGIPTSLGIILFAVTACADPGGRTLFVEPRPDSNGEIAIEDVYDHDTLDAENQTDTPETASCTEGLGCDDRDPCTVDDVCRAGVCRGVALTCDDEIPCTLDRCVGGACRHEIAPGFCRLDGVCFVDQQKKPDNGCLICDAETSRGSWTSRDGLKCDDGDGCTTGDACGAGVCAGEPVTTGICAPEPEPEPEPEPTCSDHFACYPDRVCVTDGGERRCATPCGSSAECGGGVCRKVPGAGNIGACVAAVGLADGSACTTDSGCASGICHEGVCRAFCLGEAGCQGFDQTCRLLRDQATSACVPNGGGLALGAMCQSGLDIHAGLCASQHCDLVPYGAVGPQALLPCAPLCQREEDCGVGQECGVVLYGEGVAPGTLPFHPQNQTPTRGAVTACYARQAVVQSLPEGSLCTSPTQCASNKCLRLDPADPNRYCSGYCASDLDCPTDMQCKTDTITLASDWLQTPWIIAQPATLQLQTLVRVCKLR